jgi:hypothetical protein
LLNKVEQNIITKEIEALVMVYALHKFRYFLLGNKFGCPKLDCGCVIIFCRTYMDARSENLFRDTLDAIILNLVHKHKLVKKVEPFILKERIMHIVGQDNKMCRCLTTSKA